MEVTITLVSLTYDYYRILRNSMAKETPTEQPVPTKAELEALKILWKHGPSTVRFVHELLNEEIKDVRYTSTLKMMQVMTEKGLLVKDESKKPQVYRAAEGREETEGEIFYTKGTKGTKKAK